MSQEIIEVNEKTAEGFKKIMQGQFDGMEESLKPFLEIMAKHVVNERQRLGGDFAVAQAIFSRTQRDLLRELMGPDLVFIVMNMTKESQMERLSKRHAGNMPEAFMNVLIKWAEMCEPAGEDEVNAYNLDITGDMTKEEVVQKVLEIAANIK